MSQFKRLPTKDEEFNTFLNDIETYLNDAPPSGVSNFDRLGIDATIQASFNTKFALWGPNWTNYTSPLTRTPNVIHKKDNHRDALEPVIREIQNAAEVSVNLTQDDRDMLRVPKRDDTRTRIEAPEVAPKLTIEKRGHLVTIIRIQNPIDPDTKAKPEGTDGVEVFQFIGDTPPPVKDWSYAGSTGRFLFPIQYEEEDLKKTAHIVARYRNPRGEFGPWSDTIEVDIS